jgi:hypothetical protein
MYVKNLSLTGKKNSSIKMCSTGFSIFSHHLDLGDAGQGCRDEDAL